MSKYEVGRCQQSMKITNACVELLHAVDEIVSHGFASGTDRDALEIVREELQTSTALALQVLWRLKQS